MLQKFDTNKDGFLSKSERNTMRLTTKKFSDERHDEIRQARERRSGREDNSPKPPERWLALYDKNKKNGSAESLREEIYSQAHFVKRSVA